MQFLKFYKRSILQAPVIVSLFLFARYSDLAVYKLHLVEIAKNMPVEYLRMVLFHARQSLTAPLLLLLRMLSN